MNKIILRGSWLVRAPREDVYNVISDFEKMPENFPAVAEKLTITKREGDCLEIDAVAKTFGRKIPVRMKTRLLPGEGYKSDNISELGTAGHEEFLLRDHPEGTMIEYSYEVVLKTRFWAVFAKPLIGWYAMRFWKKAFIDRLKDMLEKA